MAEPPARLTVTRPGPGTLSDNYAMTVSLDGEVVGRLLAGRTVDLEVAPGAHRLRIHNTLVWKTLELQCAPGEHVRLVAENRAGMMTTIMAVIGTGWFYLDVRKECDRRRGPHDT